MGCVVIHHSVQHLYLSLFQPCDGGCALPRLSAEEGQGSTSASPGFQPSANQLYQTSSNSTSASYDSKYGKCLCWKLMPRYGFDIKKSLMEDKRHRSCTLIETPKSTSHQWVCSCEEKWWLWTASFGFYACDLVSHGHADCFFLFHWVLFSQPNEKGKKKWSGYARLNATVVSVAVR